MLLFVIISLYMFYQHILFHLLHLRVFTAHVSKKDLCCLMSLIILIFFRDVHVYFCLSFFVFVKESALFMIAYYYWDFVSFFVTICLGVATCVDLMFEGRICLLQKLGWLRFIKHNRFLIFQCQHVCEIEIEDYSLWW